MVFWAQDHRVLWNNPSMIPNKNMSLNDKLNALTRLIGVVCLSLWAVNTETNTSPIIWGTILIFVIWLIWKFHTTQVESFGPTPNVISSKKDPFSKKRCKYPSQNNPFMNMSPYDFGSQSEFLPACRGPEISNYSETLFLKDTYEDGTDLFDRKSNSSRQWIVAPNHIDPDSYQFYVNWRLKGLPTCKENVEYCRPKMHAGQSWLDAN
jgi:hypothetical protein